MQFTCILSLTYDFTMTKNDKFIARHIIEVRLENKQFSFIDYKGYLLDFLIREVGGKKIKVQEQRVDVTTEDGSFVTFLVGKILVFKLKQKTIFRVFMIKLINSSL